MDLSARIQVIEEIRERWARDTGGTASEAARRTAQAAQLPEQMVRVQLDAVVARADPAAMVAQVREHYGGEDRLDDAPARMMHLVAGTVPGLAVESLLWGLLTPARHVVVPSRRDPSVRALADIAGAADGWTRRRIDLVDAPDFSCEAAVVMGTDDTVSLVQARMGPQARLSSFGHRVSAAVGQLEALTAAVDQLADDIARFAQRGCMSPTVVFVTDSPGAGAAARAALAGLAEDLERAIARYCESVGLASPTADESRHADDMRRLSRMAGATSAQASYAKIHVEIIGAPEPDTATRALHAPLSTVVAPDPARLSASWRTALQSAGASRIVAPGRAHELETAHWHEGIGHLTGILCPT